MGDNGEFSDYITEKQEAAKKKARTGVSPDRDK